LSVEVIPLPKFHWYCVPDVVVSDERLLNWKELPLRHWVESLMENLAFGERLTVIFFLKVSEQPRLEVAMSVTVNAPAWGNE